MVAMCERERAEDKCSGRVRVVKSIRRFAVNATTQFERRGHSGMRKVRPHAIYGKLISSASNIFKG